MTDRPGADGRGPVALPRLVRQSGWFPALVMSAVLLVACVAAGLAAPSDATVAGEIVEVCSASRDHELVRVSSVVATTDCSTPVVARPADERWLVLSFISADPGLLTGRGVPVRVDSAARSVSLVSAARAEGSLAPARRTVVFVEVPADALPPRPFVIRDAEGDTLVSVGRNG